MGDQMLAPEDSEDYGGYEDYDDYENNAKEEYEEEDYEEAVADIALAAQQFEQRFRWAKFEYYTATELKH